MATEVVVEKRPIERTHIEWGPVFAGAIAAAALSSVLLSAGAAIGLSLISAYPGHSYARSAGTLAAAWSLVVVIGSFLLGGYIAGRLRSPWGEASADEVAFRDGMHGFLVWAIGIIFGVLIALAAGVTAARISAEVTSHGDVLAPVTDKLLRSQATAPTTGSLDRGEVERILAASVANGQMKTEDRAYLGQKVAQHAGVPQDEAEKRVDAAFADAQQAVEKARKASALTALVTASALLIGLAAAWYGAQRGGHNRDHNVWPSRPVVRRPQVPLRS